MRFQTLLFSCLLFLTILCVVEGKQQKGGAKKGKKEKGKGSGGGIGGMVKKGVETVKGALSKSDSKDDDKDDNGDDDDDDDDDNDRRQKRRKRRREEQRRRRDDDDDDDDDDWDDEDECDDRKRKVYKRCKKFTRKWCKLAAKAAADDNDDDDPVYVMSPFKQPNRLLPRVREWFPQLPRRRYIRDVPVEYHHPDPFSYHPQQPVQPSNQSTVLNQPSTEPIQHHKLTIKVTGNDNKEN